MRLKKLLLFGALGLSTSIWAADDRFPAEQPVRVSVNVPEYPAIARRYNVSGTVTATLRIEKDGHVSKTEIHMSPADVLSEAVVSTTSKWTYKPMTAPVEVMIGFPFELEGGEYAFSTSARNLMTPVPNSASELGAQLTEGWSHVRLLIDANGAVIGKLVLKSSGSEFNASRDAILSLLRFAPAAENVKGTKATTVNLFFIRVIEGGEIRFSQLPGT